ncbi:MAG: hypothetical protein PHW50_03240 [Patescibacteria group bacterium]|nr:hypothetical protein [Patescibacteria group bacterium]
MKKTGLLQIYGVLSQAWELPDSFNNLIGSVIDRDMLEAAGIIHFKIELNGKSANLNSKIESGDQITIIPQKYS